MASDTPKALDLLFVVIVLALGAMALFIGARRAITVAELEIRDGIVRVVRGGITPRVLSDLADVSRRTRIEDAYVRIVRQRGRAKVIISGRITDDQAQRIRNVTGSVPLAKLANVRRRR